MYTRVVHNPYFAALYLLILIVFIFLDRMAPLVFSSSALSSVTHFGLIVFQGSGETRFERPAALFLVLLFCVAASHTYYIARQVVSSDVFFPEDVRSDGGFIRRLKWGFPLIWLVLIAVTFLIPGDYPFIPPIRTSSRLGFAAMSFISVYCAQFIALLVAVSWKSGTQGEAARL